MFNLVDEVVTEDHGADTWDDILEDAGLHGAYTALGNYPDEDLLAIVRVAADRLQVERADVLRYIGQRSMPMLATRYPAFFAVDDLRTFLMSLNDVIHPEVRKLYPDAVVPVFDYGDLPDGGLRMTYHSPRQLCYLAEGFALGAATEFDEEIAVEQPTCTWRGDAECVIHVRFAGDA